MTDSPLDLFNPSNLTDQEQARHANLRGLIAAGIDPYPAHVERTHTIAQARALYEAGASDETVTVTGRITRNRDMGKLSFANIEDGTGNIQLAVAPRQSSRGLLQRHLEEAHRPRRLYRRDRQIDRHQDG